jgi:hypothetical protein
MNLRAAAVLLLTLLSGGLQAYPDQTPPAHTGGFGEQTCATCHFSDVRDAAPVLSVSGLPPLFTPGEQYTLTLTVTDPGVPRAGFQMSARFLEAPCEACQAGELPPGDGLLRSEQDGITYLSQREAASWLRNRDGWQVVWRAPEQAGTVVFDIVLNLSDGDESPLGDQIYQKRVTLKAE